VSLNPSYTRQGETWFDRGEMGRLEFLGRLDQQVKIPEVYQG